MPEAIADSYLALGLSESCPISYYEISKFPYDFSFGFCEVKLPLCLLV